MPKGVPLSAEEREQVRHRIFQAATQLFLRQGFHETSMRQIARVVRMGKSTLYDYFSNKEDILLFFVEQEMTVINKAASDIAAQDLNAPEKLRRMLQVQWAYVSTNQELAALLTREVSRLGAEATRWVVQKRMEYRRILEQIVQQGITEGTFRAVDPTLAASALHSLITMPFYDWLRRREGNAGELIADALVDLFLHGILKQ